MKVAMKILAAMTAVMIAGPAMAGTIRIQPKASVEDSAVRVGDIATLADLGKDAEGIAEVVVIESLPKEGTKIRAEQILFAIAASKGAKAAAQVQIAGSAECLVVHKGDEAKLAALAASQAAGSQSISKTAESNRTVTAESMSEKHEAAPAVQAAAPQASKAPATKANTLGRLILDKVCEDNQANRDDIRLDFDTISPHLDTPVANGQRWMFKSSSRALGTIQWEAQLVEGTKVVTKLSVMGKVTRRQTVLVTTAPIARGEIISASQVREDEMWMDRKLPTLVLSAADVVGHEATRSMGVGSMLDTKDVKPAEMVARNETLTVYAVAGNLMIKGTVRALEPGKLRETIRVKNDATGQTYEVTLIGRRLAAAGGSVDAAMEKRIKEMP